jgi:hypothetical protein
MPERKPWFMVLRPEQANQPGSRWVRIGAASQGKISATPVSWEGWVALLGCILLLVLALLLTWVSGFAGGRLTLLAAVIVSIVAIAVLVGGLVWIVRTRSTTLPAAPSGYPPK